MTLIIELPPEKEARLRAQAAAHGHGVGEYLLSLADQQGEPAEPPGEYDPGPAIALLQSWMEEDNEAAIQEQRDTFAYLERVMDEDSPGQRRFSGQGYNPPADLEGYVEP